MNLGTMPETRRTSRSLSTSKCLNLPHSWFILSYDEMWQWILKWFPIYIWMMNSCFRYVLYVSCRVLSQVAENLASKRLRVTLDSTRQEISISRRHLYYKSGAISDSARTEHDPTWFHSPSQTREMTHALNEATCIFLHHGVHFSETKGKQVSTCLPLSCLGLLLTYGYRPRVQVI